MRIRPLEVVIEKTSQIAANGLSSIGWYPGVLGYGGYGSERQARIMARVLMTRTGDQRNWLTERRGWRQYLDAQVPRQRVVVQLGEATVQARTDAGGYLDVVLDGHGLAPGWQSAQMRLISGRRISRAFPVPIRIVGEAERFGIVSDVDDTIMETMVPHILRAARLVLLERGSRRRVVPGMDQFLHELAPEAPVMYLSTGAWNVASTLRRFIHRTGYPKGTALLRAWGISAHGLPVSGVNHKLAEFDRLTQMLPHVRWYLVGDNGQHDPTTYTTIAQRYPDRVAGIFIRTLTGSQQLLAHGTPAPLDRQVGKVDPSIPVVYGPDGFTLEAKRPKPL